MSNGRVTITLGHGQKVVKRSPGNNGGARNDSQSLSGSKRSSDNTFSNRAVDDSLLYSNKRIRGDDDLRNSIGPRIGQDDLRLKLLRKRMTESSSQSQSPPRARSPPQARTRIFRPHHSSVQSERSSVSSIPLRNELHRVNSVRMNQTPTIKASPENISYINELPKVGPTRSTGIVRGEVGPSRSTGPGPVRPVTEVPMSSSPIKSTQPDPLPLTVSSFLESLDLGKYTINFQAEEVDMIALKQMVDKDLKELGLPMGPRKKILLSLLPHTKRPAK